MNQSALLYQLQTIDNHLNQAQNLLSAINTELADNQEIVNAEEGLHQAKQTAQIIHQKLRSVEEEYKVVEIKIKMSEASLYSGKIHNPKELQDIEHEILSLRKRLASLEEKQLSAMMEYEDTENSLNTAEKNIAAVQASDITKNAGLRGQASELERKIESLTDERRFTVSMIEPNALSIYERLIKSKRGIAVCSIVDDACSACGSSIRPAEKQAAKTSSLIILCSSCGRILFAG